MSMRAEYCTSSVFVDEKSGQHFELGLSFRFGVLLLCGESFYSPPHVVSRERIYVYPKRYI